MKKFDEYTASAFGDFQFTVYSEQLDKQDNPLVKISVNKSRQDYRVDAPLKPAEVNWCAYGSQGAEFAQIFCSVLLEAVALAQQLDDGWRPEVRPEEEIKAEARREKVLN